MTGKIKIVCRECGSEDIRRDAWASWDVETQQWELASTFDDFFCEDCSKTVSTDEVPVEEDA